METEKLFWKDAYMAEFEAVVISVSVENEGTGKFIVLDKTAFYPHGGGQPCDTGKLLKEVQIDGKSDVAVWSVKSVIKKDGNIIHELEGPDEIKIGDKMHGYINWNRRHELMKMHTTAHLLSAIIHKETGVLITGNQLGENESRIDFALRDFSKEKAQDYIDRANSIIQQNLPVTSYIVKMVDVAGDESLFKLAKGFPADMQEIRIVEIKGVDKQADGGTHVLFLGEIGKIVLVKTENKGKDNRRIYFKLEKV